jgi:hypothetical protein
MSDQKAGRYRFGGNYSPMTILLVGLHDPLDHWSDLKYGASPYLGLEKGGFISIEM